MAETPTRAGPTLVGTSTTTIYTAGGAGTWTILRNAVIANETAGTVTASLGVGTTNADAAGKRLLSSVSIDPGESADFSGFVPLAGHASTPDLVYAICNTAAGVTVTLGLVTGP